MTEKNIVVIGASYAGLSTAHYFLRHVLPTLSADVTYRVVLVGPSTHALNRVAGPRWIASQTPPGIKAENVLTPIADGFKQYPAKNFQFVQGLATDIDTSARTVTVDLTDGSGRTTVTYHSLVIATGYRTPVDAWSNEGDVSKVQASIDDYRTKIAAAKNIVIGGGGPAGVETAGEIAEIINGSPGWFSSGVTNPKVEVTVVTADSKLLPILRPALATQAEKYLKRVGANVVYSTKVLSQTVSENGSQTVLQLSTGETLTTDLYIPATGGILNNSFVPKDLLTSGGKINSDKTLRVPAAGPRVYAVGDIGGHSPRGGLFPLLNTIPVLLTNVKRDLLAFESSEGKDSTPKGPDREYEDKEVEMQVVPVGLSKGVGAAFGWKVPSFFVWLIKGRDYLSPGFAKWVDGTQWKSESKWKGEK